MLDQNLLDKQLVLESMVDLLEKCANGFNQNQANQQRSHLNSQHYISNFLSIFFEMSSIKLLLITSLSYHLLILYYV
jgi:hypothetical protein